MLIENHALAIQGSCFTANGSRQFSHQSSSGTSFATVVRRGISAALASPAWPVCFGVE